MVTVAAMPTVRIVTAVIRVRLALGVVHLSHGAEYIPLGGI